MLITWTWLIAALALGVLAGLLLVALRRRAARATAPQHGDAPHSAAAPHRAGEPPAPLATPAVDAGASAQAAKAAARQLRQAREQARERARQVRQARAASQAAAPDAVAPATARAPAKVDLNLDLNLDLQVWPDTTAPLAAPAPVPEAEPAPEACARTAQVADAVQAARQDRSPAPPLPLAPAVAAAQPRHRPARPPTPALVLVVDDAKTVRVKIGRLLQAQGLRLAYAVDGEDALRQLAHETPDLVITDMDMPGLDGLGLARALRGRADTAALPVVMVSAADERLRAQAAQAGVSALLGKPFGDERLVELVRTLLAGQPASAALAVDAAQPA